jgi:predicted dehydrogenase
MFNKSNRRQFLQTSAAIGVGYWVAGGVKAQESKSANERIQMAAIGVDGKGRSDSRDAARYGKIVAVCDVDDRKLEAAAKLYPDVQKYNDFRKLLEELGEKIDAVTVSTPDHTHAPAAVMAMKLGKHCFCQKPLTHTIYEARYMANLAREKGVKTQMGNQGTAENGVREAAAILRSGGLGEVSEVHVWTNRPIWKQGVERPAPKPQGPPKHLHWDLWLGPAPERPYADGYHPFSWRGWWDFGTGALGDMACHTVNMPFMGLDLRDPTSVQAITSGHNRDSYPQRSTITFEFPANDFRSAVKLIWYDGGDNRPSKELLEGKNPSGSGSLIVGSKGKLYSPNDYGAEFELLGGLQKPEVEYEQSPGHFEEWVEAIKGEREQARSNFPDYAGPLTETILLGNLAVWVATKADEPGEKVEWDAKNMKAKNVEGLEQVLKPEYREGYSL